MSPVKTFGPNPPITEDTSGRTLRAVEAVFAAAEAALDGAVDAKRSQLNGPRVPKPSARKRRRREVHASRRANR